MDVKIVYYYIPVNTLTVWRIGFSVELYWIGREFGWVKSHPVECSARLKAIQ